MVQLEVMLQGNGKTSLSKRKQAQLLTCGTPLVLQLERNNITQQQLLPSKPAHVKVAFSKQERNTLKLDDHKQTHWSMPTEDMA